MKLAPTRPSTARSVLAAAVGQPTARPHAYIRGGTGQAKDAVPARHGRVRASPRRRPQRRAPSLAQGGSWWRSWRPCRADAAAAEATRACWEAWQAGLRERFTLPADLPPLRALLIWDNLTATRARTWCSGCAPTGDALVHALGGSWPNMAESVQAHPRPGAPWMATTPKLPSRSWTAGRHRPGAGTRPQPRSSGAATVGSAAGGPAAGGRSRRAARPRRLRGTHPSPTPSSPLNV